MFEEYLWNYDMARLTLAVNSSAEMYNSAVGYIAPYGPALAFLCVVYITMGLGRCRLPVLRQISSAGKWVKMILRGILPMRGKDGRLLTREQQHEELQDFLIDKIEAMKDAGKGTLTDANHWYATFAKAFPKLRHAIQSPTQGEETMRESQLNRERDGEGKVISLPLPGGDAAPAKASALTRSK